MFETVITFLNVDNKNTRRAKSHVGFEPHQNENAVMKFQVWLEKIQHFRFSLYTSVPSVLLPVSIAQLHIAGSIKN